MDNKRKKSIIWTLIVILLLVGAIGPVVSVVIRKISNDTPAETIATRIYAKVDYRLIVAQAVSLPITWGFVNSAGDTSGIGIKLLEVKRSFPHNKTIQVVLAGKAFYKGSGEPMQSDAEVRAVLSVIPKDGVLHVSSVAIDTIRLFDFSKSVQQEFLRNKEYITIELEKHISQKLTSIPVGASEIYEMTADQIVFLSK